VFTGSLGFIEVTWIPMGSCSPEWALSVVGGVGLDGLHISGVAKAIFQAGRGAEEVPWG